MSPAPRPRIHLCTAYVFPPARPKGFFPIRRKVILKSSSFWAFLLSFLELLTQYNGKGMRGVYLRFIPSSEGQRKLVPKLEGHVSTTS